MPPRFWWVCWLLLGCKTIRTTDTGFEILVYDDTGDTSDTGASSP